MARELGGGGREGRFLEEGDGLSDFCWHSGSHQPSSKSHSGGGLLLPRPTSSTPSRGHPVGGWATWGCALPGPQVSKPSLSLLPRPAYPEGILSAWLAERIAFFGGSPSQGTRSPISNQRKEFDLLPVKRTRSVPLPDRQHLGVFLPVQPAVCGHWRLHMYYLEDHRKTQPWTNNGKFLNWGNM